MISRCPVGTSFHMASQSAPPAQEPAQSSQSETKGELDYDIDLSVFRWVRLHRACGRRYQVRRPPGAQPFDWGTYPPGVDYTDPGALTDGPCRCVCPVDSCRLPVGDPRCTCNPCRKCGTRFQESKSRHGSGRDPVCKACACHGCLEKSKLGLAIDVSPAQTGSHYCETCRTPPPDVPERQTRG